MSQIAIFHASDNTGHRDNSQRPRRHAIGLSSAHRLAGKVFGLFAAELARCQEVMGSAPTLSYFPRGPRYFAVLVSLIE